MFDSVSGLSTSQLPGVWERNRLLEGQRLSLLFFVLFYGDCFCLLKILNYLIKHQLMPFIHWTGFWVCLESQHSLGAGWGLGICFLTPKRLGDPLPQYEV